MCPSLSFRQICYDVDTRLTRLVLRGSDEDPKELCRKISLVVKLVPDCGHDIGNRMNKINIKKIQLDPIFGYFPTY